MYIDYHRLFNLSIEEIVYIIKNLQRLFMKYKMIEGDTVEQLWENLGEGLEGKPYRGRKWVKIWVGRRLYYCANTQSHSGVPC